MDYIPVSPQDRTAMLEVIGVASPEQLFAPVPQAARVRELALGAGVSELTLVKTFEGIAAKNATMRDYLCFKGAGIYEHFIPALVDEVINRSEFATAYTPYQPEASQGTLQAVFEYQSLIAGLTGLDVANASLYDGASATAEAALLAMRATGRKKLIISSALHPEYLQVLRTYLQGSPVEIVQLPLENGATAFNDAAKALVDGATAAVIVQSPNFFGTVENLAAFGSFVKSAGALLVTVVNPLSLGILKSPGEAGADVAVGEGQVLGNPAGCGGISFGFMACRKELAWKMPGRIVGQTVDAKGRRGYVLTLQSREQHIRREKATSNICTNAALNALAGCVFLAGWGPDGLRRLAEANLQKSHYAFDRISRIPGFEPAFPGQKFFNEFTIRTKRDIGQLQKKLLAEKIIGPVEVRRFYGDHADNLLFCVTETKSKMDIDRMVNVLAG